MATGSFQDLTPEQAEILRMVNIAKASGDALGMDLVKEAEVKHENFLPINGLPTNGYFYRDSILGQPVKVEDLLLIQGIDESNVNNRFTEIFNRRLKGINPNEILLADEVYICFWLRASSYPGVPFSSIGFDCAHCDHVVTNDESGGFSFNDISFEIQNKDELIQLYDKKGYIEFTLPSGIKGKLSLRQRKHFLRVQSILKRDYYDYGRTPSEVDEELMVLLSAVDIGYSDLRETLNAVKNEFSPLDYVSLLKIIKKNSLSTEITVNHTCPACEEVTPMKGYRFRPEIFFPGLS